MVQKLFIFLEGGAGGWMCNTTASKKTIEQITKMCKASGDNINLPQ